MFDNKGRIILIRNLEVCFMGWIENMDKAGNLANSFVLVQSDGLDSFLNGEGAKYGGSAGEATVKRKLAGSKTSNVVIVAETGGEYKRMIADDRLDPVPVERDEQIFPFAIAFNATVNQIRRTLEGWGYVENMLTGE